MWKAFLKFQRRNRKTLWKFSVPILLCAALVNGGWTRVDQLALVVGNRPITLSEVRARVYLQSGGCLSEPLTAENKKQIERMIASEKLYQAATEFGKFKLQPRIIRQAMRVINLSRGFRLLNKEQLQKCHISLPLLEEILRRELVVRHYIQSRSGLIKSGKDSLMILASRLEPDIPVVNLLFRTDQEKNIPDSTVIQSEKH